MLESRIPRPLTDAERAKILRAHQKIADAEESAREIVRRAIAKRDAEIAAAVKAGASQTEVARALGLRRQSIHNALKRAEGG